MRRVLLPALLLAALVGAWQLAASTGFLAGVLGLEDFLVPSPAEIADSLWENRSLLADNAWVTLQEIVLGLGCALLAGVGFAVLMHLSGVVRDAAYPLIVASQTIPIVVLAPILLTWFGFGIGPKIVVVALICFFPVTVNVLDGLRSTEPDTIKLMRSLDASRWQAFHRVEAPAALPSFFTGAKIAVVLAPIGAVLGELVGGSSGTSGLGRLIFEDNARLEIAREFAAVAVLSAMALVLIGLAALAERRVVSWR
jgi:NitT/TauT family transport system permease protein/putative hydroxymethylpyrimidine transport system permease protein